MSSSLCEQRSPGHSGAGPGPCCKGPSLPTLCLDLAWAVGVWLGCGGLSRTVSGIMHLLLRGPGGVMGGLVEGKQQALQRGRGVKGQKALGSPSPQRRAPSQFDLSFARAGF